MLLILSHLFIGQLFSFTFTIMGDTGKGNEGQWSVSRTLKSVCNLRDCQFNLMVGDNFYQEGVTSADDPQFYEKFEKQYADILLPFYVVLGNHDYGKFANDWKRGEYQLDYARRNPQFVLPSFYYYYERDNVLFIALDTARLMWKKDYDEQEAMVKEALANNKAKWIIVYGHHPYISNGNHGNAGNYERLPFPPMVAGTYVKRFFDQNICGKVDVYMAGHEHNMQILPATETCETLFVVSGAGATTTKLTERNPYIYQTEDLGFVLANVEEDKISLEVINVLGDTMYTHAIEK